MLILYPWKETLTWKDDCFKFSPIWIQVWQVLFYWISVDTGKKIGMMLGNVLDVLIPETGGKENRHIKILAEVDLSKPLMRGTMLRFKQSEIWVQFKYEQFPTFCFYCGCVGHNERACQLRKEDLGLSCLKEEQFVVASGVWERKYRRIKRELIESRQ